MNAEILATGDEIRTGALIDTNTAHIAELLEAGDVTVVRHHCVGDDLDMLTATLREIAGRSDLAVVTGGLGPTTDDLSAAAAALAAGVALNTHDAALRSMEAFFASRGREIGPSNRKQADLPVGAECLPNPMGTAPGFTMVIAGCRFYFLPGVPEEMRRMMAAEVMPRIPAATGGEVSLNRMRTVGVFGLTEASVNRRLQDFSKRFADIKLGFRARFPVIEVKLYGHGSSETALSVRLQEAVEWVGRQLGDTVYTQTRLSMAAVVGDLLVTKKASLAVAESCTGGLVSNWLTDVPGSSRYFAGGAVTYANAAKTKLLGVPAKIIDAHGAVSEETVRAMAGGVLQAVNADYAVATSGIAGPDGGSPDKPVGLVWIAVAAPGGITSFQRRFPVPDREKNKALFAMTALDALRRELQGLPP